MYINNNSHKLILASGSPRRKELIEIAGIEIQVIPSDFDEEQANGMEPKKFVSYLAEQKALVVAKKNTKSWVIGADTIVVADQGEILGKPKDKEDALRMIALLAGRTHQVLTAFSLINSDKKITETILSVTDVTMRNLSVSERSAYVATNEPYDKAGAYGIQAIAGGFVSTIHGSYSNVMGIDICTLITTLLKHDLILAKDD